MGFHFYTDGWWRNPKNAVTTEATIVEIRKTHRFGGSEYKNAGYYHSVVVDVSDPETGQITRTTNSEVYSGLQPFQVGQRITVRWSAKRKTFELLSWNTAPEGDGTAGAQGLPRRFRVPGSRRCQVRSCLLIRQRVWSRCWAHLGLAAPRASEW